MAIYTWLCEKCGHVEETVQSISAYSDPATKRIPEHCSSSMERMLTVNGANAAINNALAGDRMYDGLVATDGTLINSRTKYRQYMKDKGVTHVSDYTNEWAKAEKDRRERFDPKKVNRKTREILEREFTIREQR